MPANNKAKKNPLGKALVRKSAQDKRKKHDVSTGFHTADIAQSNNPLQSITDSTNLEDFMASAVLADRDFTAERYKVSIIQDELETLRNAGGGSFGPIVAPTLSETESGTVENIQIPRRPVWNDEMTPEELHTAEKEAFLKWRREVAEAEMRRGAGVKDIDRPDQVAHVTPFEKNIEVWRQLWRVIEKSDVVVQIVDARNPLMYRSEDLEAYVREVSQYKRCMLLINKADYLTPLQRRAWAQYFTEHDIDFIFFSAKRELTRLEELDRRNRDVAAAVASQPLLSKPSTDKLGSILKRGGDLKSGSADILSTKRKGKSNVNPFAALMDDDDDADDKDINDSTPAEESKGLDERDEEEIDRSDESSKLSIVPPSYVEPPNPYEHDLDGLDPSDALYSMCRILDRDQLMDMLQERHGDLRGQLGTGSDAARRRRAEHLQSRLTKLKQEREEEMRKRRETATRMIEAGLGAHVRFGGLGDAAFDLDPSRDEEDELRQLIEEAEQTPPLVVGMVGYPNVGKSSTINALLGATAVVHGSKRVAVGSTPGKTKHFQTLMLTDDITLCDCPGLVFPSFISSREEMVVNGVLPIDQLRDHSAPVRLLCQRVPRLTLEQHYGIQLPLPASFKAEVQAVLANAGAGVDKAELRRLALLKKRISIRQPTVGELLDTFCAARGFNAQGHSGFDHPRAARLLLKDYCEGRLVYCHPPPGGWAQWGPVQAGLSNADKEAIAKVSKAIVGAGASSNSNKTFKKGVTMEDNVLLPSVVRSGGGKFLAASETLEAVVNTATKDQNLSTPAEEVAEYEDEEIAEAGEEDYEEIAEEDLLAFARVIPVSKDLVDYETASEEGEEEEEVEEDGEENSGTISTRARKQRQPRERGLGKFGQKRKGERAADPYNTAAAADAAMRPFLAAEVAAVTNGGYTAALAEVAASGDAPANSAAQDPLLQSYFASGTVAETAKRHQIASKAGISSSIKGVLPAGVSNDSAGLGNIRVTRQVMPGGAVVVDAVPSVMRGALRVMKVPQGFVNKDLS